LLNSACLTPNGQITIPRSILKHLGITGGSTLTIELEDNRLVLKKVEKKVEEFTRIGCMES
jgi:AbrB family looped-hinge helix DNA binding protein